MARQEQAVEDLQLRLNAGSLQDRLGEIVEGMKNAFEKLERVIQVRYAVLQDGTFHVVVIHVLDDVGSALRTVCKKSIEIEGAFPDVEIEPLVLHKDEVLDEHLAGTKPVFSKTEQRIKNELAH